MHASTLLFLVSAYFLRSVQAGDEGPGTAFHFLFEDVQSDIPNTTVPVESLADGGIPSWLHATKFNNGFGRFGGKDFQLNYLFDVMAYVQKWRIDGNKVSFANKFIDSQYFQDSFKGIPTYRTFGGTSPPMTKTQKVRTLTHILSDNLNVNIQKFGDRLLAISDMAGAMEISESTLDTIGLIKFNDSISGALSMITCAHPNKLPDEPYWYNYYVDVFGNMPHWKQPSKYTLYRIDGRQGKMLRREALLDIPIDSGNINYMHSFAHTPNYIVFFEFPLHWDIIGIITATKILPEMNWIPGNGTRVRVIDKRSWKIVKEYFMEPFFAYHHVNAYEDSGDVIVDITTVPCTGGASGAASCNHMNAFNLKTLPNNSWPIPPNALKRITVPVSSARRSISSVMLADAKFDLPAFNEKLRGRKYRYVYGNSDHGSGVWWNGLVKYDLSTGEQLEWYEPGAWPSEPNFIPRPGSSAEDDGVLLSTILSGNKNTSYLLILNATTMKPLARALAPHFLPFPSHGFAEQDPSSL